MEEMRDGAAYQMNHVDSISQIRPSGTYSNRTPSPLSYRDAVGHDRSHDPFATPGFSGLDQEADASYPFAGVSPDDVTATRNRLRSQYDLQPRKTRQTIPYSRTTGVQSWIPEIFATAVAIVSLVGIVITLVLYDGKPMPNWPSYITINTVVSFLVVLVKALMVLPVAQGLGQSKWQHFRVSRPLIHLNYFDSASRGPFGSIRLLWSLRGAHLASLGAAIMILALFIDPFAQQLIRYESCAFIAPDLIASIPRTNNYTYGGVHTGALLSSLDAGMLSAINSGVVGSATNITGSQCPSGNCTFQGNPSTHAAYRSLGVCSECTDISRQVVKNCSNPNLCTYVTSDGAWLYETFEGFFSQLVSQYIPLNSDDRTDFAKSQFITWTNQNTTSTAKSWSYDSPPYYLLATECRLYPCVNTYNATIEAGILTENLLESQEMWQILPNNTGLEAFALAPMPCLRGTQYTDATAFETVPAASDTDWVELYGLLPNNQSAYVPLECYFTVGTNSILSITEYLSNYLQGNITGMNPDAFAGTPAAWITTLFNNSNATLSTISTVYSNLAAAMTAQMRRNPDNSMGTAEPAMGYVLVNETCIRISWAWLSLPAILMLATVIFLAAIIIQNSHEGRPEGSWKSSSLPLVFHPLDVATRQGYGMTEKEYEMKDIAAAMRVRFRQHDDELGWVLEEKHAIQAE